VYILIACSSKNLCGIAQLDVGYVTVCFAERIVRVIWCSMAQHGWLGMLQELLEEQFPERYLSEEFIESHLNEFNALRQGSCTVPKYEAHFMELL
jgi:hypothetical protein